MNDTFNPGGNMNLSGTRGLGLDMEPWAYEARGRNKGLRQGRQQGREEGFSEGHTKGYQSGRTEGFDNGLLGGIQIGRQQAWNEANAIIEKLNADFSKERDDAKRLGVSMNALRRTLETLIEKNPGSTSYIRKLFKSNYEDEVRSGLRDGEIRIEPHRDPTFEDCAPKMNAFLRSVI